MLRKCSVPLLFLGFLLLFAGVLVQALVSPVIGVVMMVSGTAALSVYIVGNVLYDWWRRRQAQTLLRSRPQLDSRCFGETYFPDRAELAARLRDSLATYLKLNLDGLLPDDNLNQTCDAQTDDPSLIWHLEENFQLGETFTTGEEFSAIEAQLKTFRDLMMFLDRHDHPRVEP